jgi:plasmid stabilization system protein ParE
VKRVNLSPEALVELSEAASWYETPQPDLALTRFPYALVFLELETEIRVLAVAHAKRHPDYWLNRLQNG